MVGLLTFGNRKFESLDGTMRTAIEPLHTAMQKMLPVVDKDTDAFTDYMVSNFPSFPSLIQYGTSLTGILLPGKYNALGE